MRSSPDNLTQRDSMRMDLINALTQTGDLAGARAEGAALMAEIAARDDDNGLVIAFAKAAVARTYTMEGDLATAEAQLVEAQQTIVVAARYRAHAQHHGAQRSVRHRDAPGRLAE